MSKIKEKIGFGKGLKHRLPSIKSLNMLKMEKNFIALEKGYPRQPYNDSNQPINFMIHRIEEELEELKEAFRQQNFTVMKEECADISNLVDYLFEQLEGILSQRRKSNNFTVKQTFRKSLNKTDDLKCQKCGKDTKWWSVFKYRNQLLCPICWDNKRFPNQSKRRITITKVDKNE